MSLPQKFGQRKEGLPNLNGSKSVEGSPVGITTKSIDFISSTIASDMAEIGCLIMDVPTKMRLTIYRMKRYYEKG